MSDFLKLAKEQSKKWIKVNDKEFLFKRMTSFQYMQLMESARNGNQEVLFKLLIESFIDWKGVKNKDILTIEGLELTKEQEEKLDDEIEFSKEAFEFFLMNNVEYIAALTNTSQEEVVHIAKKNEEVKKK